MSPCPPWTSTISWASLSPPDPDGKLYQLPDQQFANLYWFRYDWFNRDDFKKQFKEKYGYELGVPVNWSAYEDIAEFFTEQVKEIDGVAVSTVTWTTVRKPRISWLALHRCMALHGRCR
jgi:glycerol transport system substrate-binding protein